MGKQKIHCINWNEMKGKKIREGVETKIFSGDKITLQLAHLKPGHAVVPNHSHPDHEQICYVISGRMDLPIGDDLVHLKAGSCIVIPPGVVHDGILQGKEDVLVMDIWTPKRTDLA